MGNNTDSNTFYIGIDDTDNSESIGTGAFCRELLFYLKKRIPVTSKGITRHQLLLSDRIPYTSHNSSKCIVVDTKAGIDEICDYTLEFVKLLYHDGSNPGVCVCSEKDNPHPDFLKFGIRCKNEVVGLGDIKPDEWGIKVFGFGDNSRGIVGATAACALRMGKNDGTFIYLKGIRDLKGEVKVSLILEKTGIDAVVDQNNEVVPSSETVITNDWIRPVLRNGKIILIVFRTNDNFFVINKKYIDIV